MKSFKTIVYSKTKLILVWQATGKETKDKIKDHKNSNGMMQSQDNLTNSKHVEIEIKL